MPGRSYVLFDSLLKSWHRSKISTFQPSLHALCLSNFSSHLFKGPHPLSMSLLVQILPTFIQNWTFQLLPIASQTNTLLQKMTHRTFMIWPLIPHIHTQIRPFLFPVLSSWGDTHRASVVTLSAYFLSVHKSIYYHSMSSSLFHLSQISPKGS